MQVRLLGTGAADGWPNPWCTCTSCQWARDAGEVRTSTSVLIDDELVIDFGPDVPRAATRFGVDLGRVRRMLLGHAHPDHTGPAGLLWRGWSTVADRPLEVIGPPAAIAACRGTTDGKDEGRAVTFREVLPGAELTCELSSGTYHLRAWPARHHGPEAGPAVLWDVTDPHGTRLLYGSDTLPLPSDEVPTGPYDLVLLEQTYGDGPPFGQHLGLETFADLLATMRRRGAVGPAGRVVAVHLGHANPPGPELRRRLELVGAELHPDGAVLDIGPRSATVPKRPRPHRVLITGGTRSGKSAEAENRLRGEPDVVYVATAPELPDDAEWTARLDAHRARRPAHWTTVETAVLAPLLREPGPPLLVDDLGLWLTRGEETAEELLDAFRASARPVVLVTGEVGSGVVPASSAGRAFRDALGRVNAQLAAEANEVWHCVAGVACRLR